MSIQLRETRDPLTLKWEMASWEDDHFAGQCGVRFPDGSIYNPKYFKLKTRESDAICL